MNELTVPKQIERRDFQRLMTYRDNLDFYNGVQWLGNPRRGERRYHSAAPASDGSRCPLVCRRFRLYKKSHLR